MTTVSSNDIFEKIGDQIKKFSSTSLIVFPTYEELSTYNNDRLKGKIIEYKGNRFTVPLPSSISTTQSNIINQVKKIITAYNRSTLDLSQIHKFDIPINEIKELIIDILRYYNYNTPDVIIKIADYTFNALFPKLNKSGYSKHIRGNTNFNNKNITLGHLYQYINIEEKTPSADTESGIILSVLNKFNKKTKSLPPQPQPISLPPQQKPQSHPKSLPPQQTQLALHLQLQQQLQLAVQTQSSPKNNLFSFLFYNKDTDTDGLSFILSKVKPDNITFDKIKDAIINYLATYEYFYKVYLHTKQTNPHFFQVIDREQEKLDKYENKYETQFTYTKQLGDNFFAITSYKDKKKRKRKNTYCD